MALVPFGNLLIPLRLYDPSYGLSQLSKSTNFNFRPLWYRYYLPWYRYLTRLQQGIAKSNNSKYKGGYNVRLDVHHFGPNDIKVTAKDNYIKVECKHEENPDHQGSVSRHFVRRYVVPDEFDIDQLKCNLSSDGILNLIAPKKSESGEKGSEVPITQTGLPATTNIEDSFEIMPPMTNSAPVDEPSDVTEASTCSCS